MKIKGMQLFELTSYISSKMSQI